MSIRITCIVWHLILFLHFSSDQFTIYCESQPISQQLVAGNVHEFHQNLSLISLFGYYIEWIQNIAYIFQWKKLSVRVSFQIQGQCIGHVKLVTCLIVRSANYEANSVYILWSVRTRHYLGGLRESTPFESWWRFVRCFEVTAVKCLIQKTGDESPLTRWMDSGLSCE